MSLQASQRVCPGLSFGHPTGFSNSTRPMVSDPSLIRSNFLHLPRWIVPSDTVYRISMADLAEAWPLPHPGDSFVPAPLLPVVTDYGYSSTADSWNIFYET
ncbi:uncharacterized protein Bfra_003551 [Botrytis fragariae]|uniref:Uncharacterized protein n=1 Tax=Botrytis fragariae TaxID=1964551 RepID=A0A8H6AWX6_9HELO|nr:uncharacterized protein Bfra_003551 [Botrytis fragariae]KAF5875098.1 hypothetical protein Bfra_003551 [Botrytis fragariae]